MIGWSTGRFEINKEQLATATDRLLVCGVKKPRLGRGSTPVLDAPLTEILDVPVLARAHRPGAALSALVFLIGGVLGFSLVTTWPF